MEYRVLGRTGIKVSEIGIGGEGFEGKNFQECEKIVDCAMNQGINFIDIYNSNPEVRSNVGKALSKYPRESYVIEGHLCSVWEDGQYKRSRDIEEVKRAYDDFLKRMNVRYVDVGMIHYVDEHSDFDVVFGGPIIEYAKQLKEQGIIKSIGISTHNVDIAMKAVDTGLVDVILFSINPAYDMIPANEDVNILFEDSTFENKEYPGIDPARARLYNACESKGVALTVMKAYGAGVLFNQERCPFGKAMTPAQCIGYCLDRPAVSSVMVGIANENEVMAAMAYESATEEEKDYSFALANAQGKNLIGHCMYCGHCAPCPKKINVALVNKYVDLAISQEKLPETIREHYGALEHHAGECIACGRCMKNCPFGVNVVEKMKTAVSIFGK